MDYEAVKWQVSEEMLQMKSDPMGGFIEGIFRKLFLAVYFRGHDGETIENEFPMWCSC